MLYYPQPSQGFRNSDMTLKMALPIHKASGLKRQELEEAATKNRQHKALGLDDKNLGRLQISGITRLQEKRDNNSRRFRDKY